MRTPRWFLLGALALFLTGFLYAGQVTWVPGVEGPTLSLNLGDGAVKQTYTLPSGAQVLTLTLRKFLLDNDKVVLTWKNDGVVWMRQTKKIPGAETTDRVALPPGRRITLEVSALGGTPVASITLRRN